MEIIKKISQEMVTAAKSKDKERLSTLRLMKSALHNKEIDVGGELKEDQVLQVLSSMIKQRKDSVEQFTNGGRVDLAEKEAHEVTIIQEFMPEQLSQAELDAEIAKAVEDVGATSPKDMGKVMKVLMPKLTGKADGKLVSARVKKALSS